MSVISRMEATPTRVRMLVRVLDERASGETEERLRGLCSPSTLHRAVQNPTTIFRESLNAAKDLGLVEEAGDKLRVRPGILARDGSLPENVLLALEAALLAPDAEGGGSDQSDFARATAWFLMQSPRKPMQFNINYKSWIEQQLAVDEDVRFDLTNSDRWNAFHYWCRFLGYGEAIGGRAMVADPSRALRRLLPRAMGSEREAAVLALLAGLARVSPVFENGRIRRELEGDAKPPFQRQPQRLSTSTSFALHRLEREGVLALDARPDAPALILDLGKDAPRRVSHVVMRSASA